MNKQLQVWQLINRCLQEEIPVMLLYVLESFGSSPGRAGFCMAVSADGQLQGSIGGGIMEHKFVELAKDKLRLAEYCKDIYKQVHDKSSLQFQSGMICSGEQTNFLYRVIKEDIEAVSEIIRCFECYDTGKLRLSPKGIQFFPGPAEEIIEFNQQDENTNDWIYEEQVGFKNNLYIIGGGHCSFALSEVASRMDFYIHVYDNRCDLNTFSKNEYAHKKTIIKNYADIQPLIPEADNTYVVVMTMGYRTDDVVIRSLLNKKFRYFGVLGSQKKMEKMISDYLEEGISENILKKIHAPIGLPINSQTPQEIAISIAAEIIKVKNEQKKQ